MVDCIAALLDELSACAFCYACLSRTFPGREKEIRDAVQELLLKRGWRVSQRACPDCGSVGELLERNR